MGFDLHGMNPDANEPQPIWSKGDPFIADGDATIVNPQIKEEYDDFCKSKWEWQEANDGAYFRNNVWWWRPLWNFVCSICDDILTEKDMEKGGWNDGHKISKTKSKKIASRIRSHIKDGQVKEYESYYTKKVAQLDDKDWNKHYPFSIDNVKQFERFCEHSGGFEIW
tara:strand:+ start:170 stop:670 length:501 start_codon:yes stop_codon:yes gene_type:complete